MQDSLISVIIPVYKVEKELPDCISSVINQTYKNIEIILVDDGSPDNCPKLCDEYCSKYPFIKVIHQKNQGLSAARNTGLANASGSYISFLDSDDCLHPEFLAKMFEMLISSNRKIACCLIQNFTGSVIYPELNPSSNELLTTSEYFDKPYFMCACAKLYEKSVLDHFAFPVGKIHEDEFTVYRLIYENSPVAYVDLPMYLYRVNDASIMHNKNFRFYDHMKEALFEQYDYFYSRKEYVLASMVLLRLTYLLKDMMVFKKETSFEIPYKLNSLIKKLPKKNIDFSTKFKAFIKVILYNV